MTHLALHATGQFPKRRLIPRGTSPDRFLADVEAWVRLEYPDAVRRTETGTADGVRELAVSFHPAASDVIISAGEDGSVGIRSWFPPVGPGYQTFVGRLAVRIGTEHGLEWTTAAEEGSPVDAPAGADVDPSVVADRQTAEHAYLTWLGSGLITAREARRRGAGTVHLGTPPGVQFQVDGALATPLGPRDDAWLDAAVTNSRLAIDVTPWWADATDARYLLNRALCLMWTEVRWRPPADDDERRVHDEVLRLLARAFPLDPSLPFPWREWHEIARMRGLDDAMTRQVEGKAERAERRPPIGYRRHPVVVVHEGWELEVPGSFTSARTAEEWSGHEAGRSITLAATETGTPSGPMTAQAFLEQVSRDLGPEALTHQDGEVYGRARLTTDASSGLEVGVLEGYSAVRGRGAAIRITFDDSNDWRWALDLWRALAPTRNESLARA
ncbi:MAG TPA: hypothetical protein VFV72_02350 [Candidatus Limnocylindrales bacterium]|nr:hypothetical protein [Candidatus Limnocylindrales bacterium]